MIKNSSDYLLVNGLYVPAIKVCHDDYISNDVFVEKGTLKIWVCLFLLLVFTVNNYSNWTIV